MKSINLAEKLSLFSEHFKPRTVGQFNGHDLMVAKPDRILVRRYAFLFLAVSIVVGAAVPTLIKVEV